MSALAMILMAGMTVGDVPGKMAGEIQEQRLDLSGEWEGTWLDFASELFNWQDRVKIKDGILTRTTSWGLSVSDPCPIFTVTGKGTFRMRTDDSVSDGIYKIEKGELVLYFEAKNKCPSSFKLKPDSLLITLHRVKPRK